MEFTFGIITGGNDQSVNMIIDSIEKQHIPSYEIIIVGGNPIERNNVIHIPFDEIIKSRWITRKKNLITQNAKYENIVYLHDYIYLEDGWYEGFIKNGNDFKICMNVIKNANGKRFRDWTLWAGLEPMRPILSNEEIDYIGSNRKFLLSYDIDYLTEYQYISGSYWVAKKDVMLENPLDEKLCWGESEDVEWSKSVRNKYKFTMNPHSSVKFMKMKDISNFHEADNKTLGILKKLKKIDFTFGIITGGGNEKNLNIIIDSIEKQNIPNYEIVIVGGDKIDRKNVVHVPFDESVKPKWITKKKNLITQHAKYENVVYMHDYIYFDDDWYQGFLKNGDDFKACMTKMKCLDGTRFRDWTLEFVIHKKLPLNFRFLIPYDMTHLSKWMYFSGAYWVAKKSLMTELPLNENRVWGQGEDVEWSQIYRRKYEFSINPYSTVHLMKDHGPIFTESNENDLILLNKIDSKEESDPYLFNRIR